VRYLKDLDIAFPSDLPLLHFPDGHRLDMAGLHAVRLGNGINEALEGRSYLIMR
jgi:hypothetical protein